MKRSTIAKTFTIAAVAALAVGIAPTANATDRGCTNATLWALSPSKAPERFIFPPAGGCPLLAVVTCTFDGNGSLTSHWDPKPKRQHPPGDANGHVYRES